VTGSTYRNNECLTCHWENRPSAGTPTHPNSVFEWSTPNSPAAKLTEGSVDASDTICLACHGGVASASLNGIAPTDIRQGGEATWPGGSGHGATAVLSIDPTVGPPAYHCADCHKSTAVLQTGGQARDQRAPTVHASINRKLVRNDNASAHEYPHPGDTDTRYDTVSERSGQMDSFCATTCQRNSKNGIPKDDNVVDHTWDKLALQSRSGSLSHPTDFLLTVGTYYKNPVNLPYSDYISGAKPGTGNVAVCVTCHNPHGGGSIVDEFNVPVTGGAKNMLRLSPADNVSSLCKECHK
jgi:hypothetical protein